LNKVNIDLFIIVMSPGKGGMVSLVSPNHFTRDKTTYRRTIKPTNKRKNRDVQLAGIFLFIFMALSGLVSSQEYDNNFIHSGWEMDNSDRIIAMGETYWINISGVPSHPFELVFTPMSHNATDELTYYGYTNETGNQSVEYDIDDTRIPGMYMIALVVNNTVYEVVELDIRYDRVRALELEIYDLEARIDDQDGVILSVRSEVGEMIVLIRKLFWAVGFLLCYFVIRNAVDLYTNAPDWVNKFVKWNRQRNFSEEQKNKHPPNPNERIFNMHGGGQILSPGQRAKVDEKYMEEYQECDGKTHDDMLEYLKGRESIGNDYPKWKGLAQSPKFKWKMLKLKNKTMKVETEAEK